MKISEIINMPEYKSVLVESRKMTQEEFDTLHGIDKSDPDYKVKRAHIESIKSADPDLYQRIVNWE